MTVGLENLHTPSGRPIEVLPAEKQIRPRDFKSLPPVEAGCPMPTHTSIVTGDSHRRHAAEEGSRRLLEALDRYFRNGGRA